MQCMVVDLDAQKTEYQDEMIINSCFIWELPSFLYNAIINVVYVSKFLDYDDPCNANVHFLTVQNIEPC